MAWINATETHVAEPWTNLDLASYLRRIGYEGRVAPDLATLRRVQRRHLMSIPYENLDVQLGRPVGFEIARIFDKLVGRRRGGWCYEMNGLLEWALRQIGFDVMRLVGAGNRDMNGDAARGNHLVLGVRLDQLYLVDVGFADGLLEPVPVAEGPIAQGLRNFRLDAQPDGAWRFHNHAQALASSFDFWDEPADEATLTEKCLWLQSAPESMFVQNAICVKFESDAIVSLRGRVLRRLTATEGTTSLLMSADELREALDRAFNIELDAVDALWKKIAMRHEALFGGQPAPR
jgi:N-hydroxyarylamine O-acetyltransferase